MNFVTCTLATVIIALGFIITPSAQAATQVLNYPVSFTIPYPIGCSNNANGEIIQFSGTEHLLYVDTVDRSGGVHINIQGNFQGTGTGQTTGDRYVLSQTGRVLSANEHIAVEFTYGFASNLIDVSSGGTVSPTVFTFITHITVNPDGTITASPINVNLLTCK